MKRGDKIVLLDMRATIKWRVDNEIGIVHDNGEMQIINLTEEAWTLIEESAPQYQTSIEHMTDSQLRESIDALRNKRLMRPEAKTKTVKSRISAPKEVETAEDKKIKSALQGKTPAQILEIKRKLGLID